MSANLSNHLVGAHYFGRRDNVLRSNTAIDFMPKILIVNDDPASLLALTSSLSTWADGAGCELVEARSGPEALRHVLQNDFAVILLDVNMPGMDGYETAEAIHNRAASASLPIIFVTAFHADEINRLQGYARGAADYLFTPVIPQILQAKVAVFVALARQNLELKKQAAELHLRAAEQAATNRRLQIEIEERQLAVRQNQAKDEFLAMLGHELRNPLSAICNAIAVLRFPTVSAEGAERAKNILLRQSRHLTHIVDDLLDLSRLRSGKIVLTRQPLSLDQLVLSCIDTLRAGGRFDGFTLEVNVTEANIAADATRLEQIITNLLDNAVKYTPKGGAISVVTRSNDEFVTLAVSDTGVGISADLLPQVFDVFVQGDSSLDRAQGGLGIGLSLVRQLVELHDGTIMVSSGGPGCGSTFTVTMPAIASAVTPLTLIDDDARVQHG